MLKRTRYLSMTGVAALLLLTAMAHADSSSSSSSASSSGAPAAPNPRVRVSTSMGDFVIEVYQDRVPFTAYNFLRYVKEGQYTHTLIHRVIANFVLQGGGHDATTYQLKPTHDPIPNESGSGLQNKRLTVGLARSNSPHSGNCQFYVNLADNPDLDPLPTRWGYAVFGRVIEGMDVIERIGVTATGGMGPFKADAPLKPVVIEKVELLSGSAAPTEEKVPVRNTAPPAVLSPQ